MKTKKSNLIEQLLKNGEITINPELDNNSNISLFPEKAKKAKEMLAKGKLPREYYEQMAKLKKEK